MDSPTEVSNPISATSSHEKVKELYELLLLSMQPVARKNGWTIPDIETPTLAVKGHRNNSDIKWNAMTGEMSMLVPDILRQKGYINIFSCKIRPLTGNCGAKAISHIYLFRNWGPEDVDVFKKQANCALNIIEDFLLHHTNCSLLVASDTVGGGTHNIITKGGEGWNFSEPVHNPNYTGGKLVSQDDTNAYKHNIVLMWKMIKDSSKYPGYFNAESKSR